MAAKVWKGSGGQLLESWRSKWTVVEQPGLKEGQQRCRDSQRCAETEKGNRGAWAEETQRTHVSLGPMVLDLGLRAVTLTIANDWGILISKPTLTAQCQLQPTADGFSSQFVGLPKAITCVELRVPIPEAAWGYWRLPLTGTSTCLLSPAHCCQRQKGKLPETST